MKLRSLLITLCCALVVMACVTEFKTDTVSIAPALVVEGQVTDQPGPYTVRLTRTADYSIQSINLLETGATVTIADNKGNREILTELSPGGMYQTRVGGLQGVVGRSYTLTIRTKAGLTYESTAEVLPGVAPIAKIYYEYTSQPRVNQLGIKQGWNVYVDTKDPDTLGNYYRWNWTHYEQLQACQKTFNQSKMVYTGIGCCTPCWQIDRCYNCIEISSDANVNGQAISRQYITQVPYTSSVRYYLSVQQQGLSRGAYQFWKSVKQLVSNTGGLFDAAPSSVAGNLRCTSDARQPVYGYFGAVGLSEQVIYVDRSTGQGRPDTDFPIEIPYPTSPPCIACQNSLYQTPVAPRGWLY
ncbi:DUF4249 domain-containing protein [Spirosoma rhododendri]|uniref:DUF4249 domain-containing protein n=1 Tax=Spirosoma rhododendri TaxID=2728024 RepID=A0A7L5DUH4_9BACT|nr:DUF4249 domain-containing protein [Spirosoma rhododendri]QJD79210.1 DUF4249 domain-containing protein [Spirosoma rhododendri]